MIGAVSTPCPSVWGGKLVGIRTKIHAMNLNKS